MDEREEHAERWKDPFHTAYKKYGTLENFTSASHKPEDMVQGSEASQETIDDYHKPQLLDANWDTSDWLRAASDNYNRCDIRPWMIHNLPTWQQIQKLIPETPKEACQLYAECLELTRTTQRYEPWILDPLHKNSIEDLEEWVREAIRKQQTWVQCHGPDRIVSSRGYIVVGKGYVIQPLWDAQMMSRDYVPKFRRGVTRIRTMKYDVWVSERLLELQKIQQVSRQKKTSRQKIPIIEQITAWEVQMDMVRAVGHFCSKMREIWQGLSLQLVWSATIGWLESSVPDSSLSLHISGASVHDSSSKGSQVYASRDELQAILETVHTASVWTDREWSNKLQQRRHPGST